MRGGTEPCERGDEQSRGPLCQPQTRIREITWDSPGEEQRERQRRKQLFSVFLFLFGSSLVFFPALSSSLASVMPVFLLFKDTLSVSFCLRIVRQM